MIGAKDFSELVTAARLKLGELGSNISNWSIGGVLRTLVELCCYGLASLYALLIKVVPMGFTKYATGKWLDLKADELGISRHPARAVEGYVYFARTEAGGPVRIPARSIVKTQTTANGQELRYFTTKEVVLQQDEYNIAVPVVAEFEGAAWNVGSNYIRVLVTHIPGIDHIFNEPDWIVTEGLDVESDEALRARCYLQWHELSTGSTAKAYESWVYKVEGVIDTSIIDTQPRGGGTVDIIIVGANGAPSDALKQSVKDYVDTRRPMCSDVLVKGPDEKKIDLEITLYMHPEKGNEDDAKLILEEILQDFFIRRSGSEIEAQKIGYDFIKARLNQYLMQIPSVVNAIILQPAADVVVDASEMAIRGDIIINVERAASL